jgi:Lon-like protease
VPLLVFAAAGIGAVTFRLPYYAISPGEAIDVSGLVQVVDGPSHDPDGQIYLTTVRLRQVSMLEAVTGWLDPSIDVVAQEVVVPPQVPTRDLSEFNLQLMDVSKQTALGVALESLGVDAITGGGAVVVSVLPGTPAEGALEAGDVVTEVDGEPVSLHYEVVRAVAERRPGDTVSLTYRRDGEDGDRTAEVTLASRGAEPDASGTTTPHDVPDAEQPPLLGVTLRTEDLEFDFPIDVEIASERIGGPSAGLAFTLEVLDLLTEGELTGGRRIAATGTIELDGSVGPVGGVAQKTVAVGRQDIELFLVPSASYEVALEVARGNGVRVEPVDDLDDALAVLEGVGGAGLGEPVGGLGRT